MKHATPFGSLALEGIRQSGQGVSSRGTIARCPDRKVAGESGFAWPRLGIEGWNIAWCPKSLCRWSPMAVGLLVRLATQDLDVRL